MAKAGISAYGAVKEETKKELNVKAKGSKNAPQKLSPNTAGAKKGASPNKGFGAKKTGLSPKGGKKGASPNKGIGAKKAVGKK